MYSVLLILKLIGKLSYVVSIAANNVFDNIAIHVQIVVDFIL